jgi:hypothetical protein
MSMTSIPLNSKFSFLIMIFMDSLFRQCYFQLVEIKFLFYLNLVFYNLVLLFFEKYNLVLLIVWI